MSKQSVAFFGATGGCALAALELTIKAGIPCSALVRTESKLVNLLTSRGLSETDVRATCHIVEGNIKDKAAVSRALLAAGGPGATTAPPTIVSGIGSLPKMQASIKQPVTLVEPGLCAAALTTILEALGELPAPARKPLITVISTTGVSSKQRDVPCAMMPMYHWMLAVPHEDKLAMEKVAESEMAPGGPARARGFVVVRPSLLQDGPAKDGVRVGWEWAADAEGADKEVGPAVGYMISRGSVGKWIFDECVYGDGRDQWAGKKVTLTS